jgi:myo-inositol-1(or 4)-monophosphatase
MLRSDEPDAVASWLTSDLETIAIEVATVAADHVREHYGQASSVGTKSSATDVVTQTDIDTENLIRRLLTERSSPCGIVGEEGDAVGAAEPLQWIIDPLDGTVNFLYSVPIFSISIAAALNGVFVAGAVVDVMRADVFSAHLGGGARLNGAEIRPSSCESLSLALVGTGFSYTPRLRAAQGEIVRRLLPRARDIRCFGSAAIQLCWVASGRLDAYFERDIKLWDWAAGSVIATEAGAQLVFPCPENDGLVLAAPPPIVSALMECTALPALRLDEL